MKLLFKLWSINNPNAIKNICPDLGMREWSALGPDEKHKIWSYFSNKDWFTKSNCVFYTIENLNERYKRKSYGQGLLKHGGPHFNVHNNGIKYFESCCLKVTLDDFLLIFLNENQDVVYEMLSLFVLQNVNTFSIENIDESDEEAKKEEIINLAYKKADKFAEDFNDIFEQFNLNVVLTRNGIVFRQDKKITEDIYIPVLTYLSGKKWGPVNRDLSDAFRRFQEKTPQGYSGCITHAISALQGFLQILVYDKIGKGDLNDLLSEAQRKKVISSDAFSTKIFKDIQSIIMQKRQESGDPHPKEEYANERSAKLVLNLIMIFIQNCILK
ncbi:MAG: hypothetical protein WC614_01545 [bacterium]